MNDTDGGILGITDGSFEGMSEGIEDGADEGSSLGAFDGNDDALGTVGFVDSDGLSLGRSDGRY